MSNIKCPVIRANDELRSGGVYVDDVEDTTTGLVSIRGAGDDQPTEIVLDEVSYFLTLMKISLARDELKWSAATTTSAKVSIMKATYDRLYSEYIGLTEAQLVCKLSQKLLGKQLLRQFDITMELIDTVETLIIHRIVNTTQVNVSLPDLSLPPRWPTMLVSRPDILRDTVNSIAEYVNCMNINALLPRQKSRIPSLSVEAPTCRPLSTRIVVTSLSPSVSLSILSSQMTSVSESISKIADDLMLIERFHCEVINYMNKINSELSFLITSLGYGSA